METPMMFAGRLLAIIVVMILLRALVVVAVRDTISMVKGWRRQSIEDPKDPKP